MNKQFVISEYIEAALQNAGYEKHEDGTFGGRVPNCPGVVAFAFTLRDCEHELQSVLEDWLLVGLKLGHRIPILNGIDLNQEPLRESVASV